MLSDTDLKVVKFVQELLLSEDDRNAITPALIDEKISLVAALNPKWARALDRQSVTDELIRRFSIWIGSDTTLSDNIGHEPWLNASRKQNWRYWQRYREWLERRLSFGAVDALDRSTDSILELLEDPMRAGPWDRRGLVVGHVQSGKTSNYTGLICKAADAGYKIVIVLAGLHNNLRSQTQMRLDEGFLGYETRPNNAEEIRVIGVGEINSDPAIRPNYATNRTDKGDFNAKAAHHLGITPEQRPWLFVVKKNKTVLERLYQWIRNHVADAIDAESSRPVVTRLPLLLIDDEADHASVDTGEQVFDEVGQPDEEHRPTAINRCIRKILHSFTRSAYVGYTATPFANIFIHERGETPLEGPDLFPSSFIINLGAPSDYIGPARVFGISRLDGVDEGLPLVREVDDFKGAEDRIGWMPPSHRNGHLPRYNEQAVPPPSLIEAVYAFVLSCAARRVLGEGDAHMSMLVHVTRFTSVQHEVKQQIEDLVRQMRQRLERDIAVGLLLDELHALWTQDFEPTSADIRSSFRGIATSYTPTWEQIQSVLPESVADIKVRTINGTAGDVLDYADNHTTGLKVIAIGGDKLARGLTLEGLCVSYFLRASKMYDTLMQMGRWFGYRPGYLDLCRLYTTSELTDWFSHITEAAEELRAEFDLMAASGATPRDYGLKVQSHPVLMVTSRLKMRSARTLRLSFSGQLLETVALFKDVETLQSNLGAMRRLLQLAGEPEVNPQRRRGGEMIHKWKGYLWSDVPSTYICDFLTDYRTRPEAYKVNSILLTEFIRSMNACGELTQWTVALIGKEETGGQRGQLEVVPKCPISLLLRADKTSLPDRYTIGRLLSGRDEAIDLDEEAWKAAHEITQNAWQRDPARQQRVKEPNAPNGPAIRHVRGFGSGNVPAHPERGLLLLYALDPTDQWEGASADTPPVIAFGISFPASNSGTTVNYEVNNVAWEQEYGGAD